MIDKSLDYIFHLAYQSVKKDKKSYLISFIVMIIAFTFTIVFTTYINTKQTTDKLLDYQRFGKWNICYEGFNEATIDLLSDTNVIDLLVNQEVTGKIDEFTYMSNYNEDFFEIAYIELLEGDLPSSNNEIIASLSDHQINDEVVIDHKTYKVVGLFNDYDEYWDTHSYKYFSYRLPVINNLTYILSQTLNKDLMNMKYNKFTNNRIQDLSIKEYKQDGYGSYYSSPRNRTNNLNVYLDSMNMFILLMGAAIFIALEYNSNKRETTIFLLRCIGMNKKDMKKYIFYEIILIMFIALGISIVIGTILSLLVCLVMSQMSGILTFNISISMSIRYILYLVGLILLVAFVSIITISVRSRESLIQKKNRTKLKKYNKKQKMSIYRLSLRLSNRYPLLLSGILLLFNVQYFTVFSIMDYADEYKNSHVSSDASGYHYLINSKEKMDFSSIEDYILDQAEYKFIKGENYIDSNAYGGLAYIYLVDLDHVDYRIVEGEEIKNNDECYMYKPFSELYFNNQKIGDQFEVVEYKEEIIIEEDGSYYYTGDYDRISLARYKSVGRVDIDVPRNIIDMFYHQDYYFYFNDILPNDYVGTYAIDDSHIKDNEVEYTVYIHSNKYLNHFINQQILNDGNTRYTILQNMHFADDSMQEKAIFAIMILSIILFISIIFMIFIIQLTVNNIDKDIRLLRCLGMTFKQSMLLYMFIFGFILLISLLYVFVYNSMSLRHFRWVVLIPTIINPIITFMIVYHKTSHSLVFYPTDVERYY